MDATRFRELEGNPRLGRRGFEQICLFQLLQLADDVGHVWRALGLGRLQKSLFRLLPVFFGLQGNHNCIESIMLTRIFFDQRIRQQQTIGENRDTACIQMRRLARPISNNFVANTS